MLSKSKSSEAVAQRCPVKKVFLKISQNSQENSCARFYCLVKLQTLPRETLARVFSYEFCKIFKNSLYTEHLRETAASKFSATALWLQY